MSYRSGGGGFSGSYKSKGRMTPYSRNGGDRNVTPSNTRPLPPREEEATPQVLMGSQKESADDTKDFATPRNEKKCSAKSRLFIGNLPRDTKENQVKDMFAEFGDVTEVFVQKEKGFGFIRMVSCNLK